MLLRVKSFLNPILPIGADFELKQAIYDLKTVNF